MMNAETFSIVFPYWIRAFAFTLAVEVPLFILLGKVIGRLKSDQPISIPRLALAGAAGTCITHPLLWFVWPLVITSYTPYIVSGELLIATVESFTFYYLARSIPFRCAVMISFIVNAVSYGLGALLNALN